MPYLALPKLPAHGLTGSQATATSRGVSRSIKVLLSTLLTATSAFAQNPPTVVVPRPGDAPAVPAPAVPPPAVPTPAIPAPAAPTPATPPANLFAAPGPNAQEPLEQLQFINTDVKDVLQFYSDKTKRKLVYSNQVAGSVYLAVGAVTRTEAIKIIEMSLAMNGFYIVPSEDPNIWKVTGLGTNPKSVGIPFIDREELLPADDQVVMFLFKLKWQDPTELATTLTSGVLFPNQTGQFTSVVPLPKANAIMVTETTSIIRTLIRVIRAIDVEPAEVVSEFITLTHAQAEDVVTNLEKLFEKQPTQQTGAPGTPGGPVVPGQPRIQRTVTDAQGNALPTTSGAPADGVVSIEIDAGSSGMGPTEDNIIIGKVKLTADKRTNRIHIVTRPINMKLIRELVLEYDANVQLPVPFVRPLRHRPVEEVMEAIVSAIADPGDREGAGGAAGAAGAGQRPAGAAGQTTTNFGNNRLGNTGAGAGGAGFDGGAGGAGALGESLSVQQVETRPLSQQVGKSTIIADQRNNSIIVVGTQDVKDKVSLLLDELDIRQAQVMIHTVIGELRLSRNEQFGLEYILRNGGVLTNAGTGTPDPGTPGTPTTNTGVVGFNDAGQSVLNLNNLLNQQNVTNILTGGSSGLSGFIMSGNSFDAVLKAFESNNRFRVVTRPSIFTSNAKRAVITSGEEVPVPTQIQSSFANTGNNVVSNSSIQFKPIELRLEVLPLINSDREVSLEIVQNISERAGSTIIDNNAIPNISRRAIKTYVTVPNNGTLILGGLIKESKDFSKSGINKLINIPIIGPLFGTTNKDKIRTELIVMMRPIVTVAPADTARLREKTFEAFAIPPDLESAIMPVGVWDKVPKARIVPRSTAPQLREERAPRGLWK